MKGKKSSLMALGFGLILLAFCLAFAYAGILLWLWNAVVVVLFGAPLITYWQAFALYVICNILFKSHNSKSKDD